MKSPKSASSTVVTGALCAVLLASIFGAISVGKDSNAQDKDRNDSIAIRDALRHGGLREAAKLKGHYVAEFDAHWDYGLFDIESLTKNSTAVIVGRVTKKLGTRIAANGQLIVTDYEIDVQEAMKGVTKDTTLTVSLPGGRVEFEDGTSAELTTPKFEHVKEGGVYTFFLSESNSAPNHYTLVGGPQGLVEIGNDSTVKSHGRSTDPVAIETKGRTKDSFLKEVHENVRKWPGPGRCCS